jgi:hypothetical protein
VKDDGGRSKQSFAEISLLRSDYTPTRARRPFDASVDPTEARYV